MKTLLALLEKAHLNLTELDTVDESSAVEMVEDCGMSGQFVGEHLYTVILTNSDEYEIYVTSEA